MTDDLAVQDATVTQEAGLDVSTKPARSGIFPSPPQELWMLKSDGRKIPSAAIMRRLKARELAVDGKSVAQISADLGVATRHVQSILEAEGLIIWKRLPPRAPRMKAPPIEAPPEDRNLDGRWLAIKQMAAQGYSSDQIAKKVGVCNEYVRRRSKKLGIENKADKATRGRHAKNIDHTHLLSQLVSDAESMVSHLPLLDVLAVDVNQLTELCSRFSSCVRSFRSFSINLKAARPL